MLNWIKNNKLVFILLIVVAVLLFKTYSPSHVVPMSEPAASDMSLSYRPTQQEKMGIGGPTSLSIPPAFDAPPAPEVANRMVMQESYLALLVKNVRESQDRIIQTTQSLGGYKVNTYLNNPQDAPTSTITVRLPADRLQEALEQFRDMAVKVVTENLSGQDVTDQFVDNEARLQTLEETKAKFEAILNQATQIDDILRANQEIINIQSQIDSLKGQQDYLSKNSEMARLTIYLSTDELALPYAPSETWRPDVIFKQAVRSLVGSFRKLATALIWLAVYSVVLIPVLLVVRYLFKNKK